MIVDVRFSLINKGKFESLEQVTGIEPALSAWEADVLQKPYK